MVLTRMDALELSYLAKARKPLWGAHMQRGESVSNQTLERWLECGFIEEVVMEGYVITAAGRAALSSCHETTKERQDAKS